MASSARSSREVSAGKKKRAGRGSRLSERKGGACEGFLRSRELDDPKVFTKTLRETGSRDNARPVRQAAIEEGQISSLSLLGFERSLEET